MTAAEILRHTAHRSWPPPKQPWVIHMTWRDLLFAHWPVALENLRTVVPEPLPIDTYDGSAWVGVIPFIMDMEVRGVPLLRRTPELNVRTYSTVESKPGVYFFSLDLASTIGVLGARVGYGLPYWLARMSAAAEMPLRETAQNADVEPRHAASPRVRYTSQRVSNPASFRGSYRATSMEVSEPQPGTLDHFLTERYCLYNVERGKVYRVPIHHLPWPLQPAEADIELNTMAAACGIVLPQREPVLHFARKLDVLGWTPQRMR